MTSKLSEKELKAFTEFSSAAEEFEKQALKCEKIKTKLIHTSPIVKFLLSEIALLGTTFNVDNIKCLPCDETRSGGFAPKYGIVLCQNQILEKSQLEDTLSHELVHLYDHATADVNWNNIRHLACSEIRAVALSGECKFNRELKRGYFGIAKHFQECVRRRAIMGVMQGSGKTQKEAEVAVRSVWQDCFNDTSPFDEIF
ncbi:Mitochondrial inner membrane protease atp23 [Boothiomyces macroporosus]|uniref:Mitochondrial inner membrane protease ATP23 n=1 Tax=Boothiomyces macroporosus TaxID=261099 RepID=A0AAD5UCV4_9FUNG|nr:Mitochondrial inner membrane protease atp23 [Boothiomyces macroporosus]